MDDVFIQQMYFFKSLFTLAWWPLNSNMPAPKLVALQISSKTQNGYFLEYGTNKSDQIS
jgi:hypothetical protein